MNLWQWIITLCGVALCAILALGSVAAMDNLLSGRSGKEAVGTSVLGLSLCIAVALLCAFLTRCAA